MATALHHALPATGERGVVGKAAPNPLLLCSLIVAVMAWEPMTGPTTGLHKWAIPALKAGMSCTWVPQAARATWGGGSRR